MRCTTKGCINPAHIKVANWNPSYGAVRKMLIQGWLTEEQADKWFGIQEAAEPARDDEPKNRPEWKTVYPAAHD
jgi:hypothetical protein